MVNLEIKNLTKIYNKKTVFHLIEVNYMYIIRKSEDKV